MPEKPAKPHAEDEDRDDRLAIPLDPETALRALLKVDPDAESVVPDPEKGSKTSDRV